MRTEFEFIRNIKKKYRLERVGDDCAVLPKDARTDLIVTADMLVEDIDFRLRWTNAEYLGHKALAVSLSDIAAMGGTPKWAMLSIGIPPTIWNGKFVDKFYTGWFGLARSHNVELIGGDVSRTPDKIVIDSVVGGEVRRGNAVLRSGARPGDSIFVTGSLGGAAAGLSLLESATRNRKVGSKQRELILRQLRPTPRIEVGKYLASRRLATSMIDISDGFVSDLYQLCDASSVGARIEVELLPVDKHIGVMPGCQSIDLALGGGEDFELLFTSARKTFPRKTRRPITRIGETTSETGLVKLVGDKFERPLPRMGYRHF